MKASTPPVGPSTLAGLTTLLVGLVGAALSLCGVVVDDETTKQLGVIVGSVVALGALGYTTWSRTRQAQAAIQPPQGVTVHGSSTTASVPTVGEITSWGTLGAPDDLSKEIPGGSVIPDGERP